MKIMICGSMSFAKEMLKLQNDLQNLGHTVFVPCDTDVHVNNPRFGDELEENHKHVVKK